MNFVNKANVVKTLITVGDYLRWTVTQLASAEVSCGHGYGDVWDESLALVLNSLKLPWDVNPAMLSASLLEDERSFIVDLVCYRVRERIPTAYLINKAWFCGLEFYVDERVLIPRSPIGELIDSGFEGVVGDQGIGTILDVCTGSGCIAIAAAHAFEGATVHATDISAEALAVAELNIQSHRCTERVSVFQGHLLEPVAGRQYDLIVSNPPYVDEHEMNELAAEFRHEPPLGLSGGQDGLDLVHQMLPQVANCLSDNGVFVCEVGNSWQALERAYPTLPLVWLEFERGGIGIFAIEAHALKSHFNIQ